MPDLDDTDRVQIAEAARQAGAKPERAHLFTRTVDLSRVPRDAGGQLDAAALAAAVGVAVADAPELTVAGWAPATSGPRRAPSAAGGAPMGASPAGSGDEAKVAYYLAEMRKLAGLPTARDAS